MTLVVIKNSHDILRIYLKLLLFNTQAHRIEHIQFQLKFLYILINANAYHK